MKKRSIYLKTALILTGISAGMNLAACSPAFCDAYTDHVYVHLAEGLGRLTARLPFPLGELLMYLGILLVLLAVIFLILLIFLHRRAGYRRFAGHYYRALLMTLLCTVFVYTFTWTVPFRGSLLGAGSTQKRTAFAYPELDALMQYAADCANTAADEIEIEADGSVRFPDVSALHTAVTAALHGTAKEFPRLAYYCPPVKTAFCSDILSRMGIGGYTYPYTMELTHSKYSAADPTFQPVLDAHELCHHLGYYKENEATFLSQLALMQSDDPFLRLAAASDLYSYAEFDYFDVREDALKELAADRGITLPTLEGVDLKATPKDELRALIDKIVETENALLGPMPELSDRVYQIKDAARGIRRAVYEADPHPIDDMPAVDNAISETASVGWETQATVLRENIYEGEVLLWLQYLDGKLY